jgi:glycosyltransferase involved in cell wall biosynthesis
MAAASIAGAPGGAMLRRAASIARRVMPVLTDAAARRIPSTPARPEQISSRLDRARQVFTDIDLFVSPSASLAREYVALGLDPRRIEVSDYGFTRQPTLDRRREGRGAVVIGFVGSMVWHKGAHVLLDAATLLKGRFELVIAGDPQVGPEYHARLKRAAAGLPVRFEGAFGRSDVPRVYSSLDVLVVPSLWPENSPLVIHEAFMHGVAVVGARHGGIPALVTDGVNGFTYDGFSAPALAAALQRFVDDPGLASRMAARAPSVKSIAEDAGGWETRYEAVLQRKAQLPA